MQLKCKMCGGELELRTARIAVCTFCGSQQVVNGISDPNLANLYDRAELYRKSGEFDKAIGALESILAQKEEDSEIHWSIALCRFGIQYVEDPHTHKLFPTFNRKLKDSFLADPDYQRALELAGPEERQLYERQAAEISRLQQTFIHPSDYDVFISYKETDENGDRTYDSEIAHRIYNELTESNIKTFFSHVTLDGHLGEDFESLIFSALDSSRVMLVVMTRPEHANATWVKNEWTRFLTMMRSDDKKRLIPVFSDMDVKELPAEFSHLSLQAQNMKKLGAMEDLILGIKKILGKNKPTVINKTNPETLSKHQAQLLRAYDFLADGDFKQSLAYLKVILDEDPTNARAHMGDFLAKNQYRVQDEDGVVLFFKRYAQEPDELRKLVNRYNEFGRSSEFRRACNYASDEYRQKLDGIVASAREALLGGVRSYLSGNNSLAAKEEAVQLLDAIKNCEEAIDMAYELKAEVIQQKKTERMNELVEKARSASLLSDVIKFTKELEELEYKDSAKLAKEIREKAMSRKYDLATKQMQTAQKEEDLREPIKLLRVLKDYRYKDADRQYAAANKKAMDLRYKAAVEYTKSYPSPEGFQKAAKMIDSAEYQGKEEYKERFDQLIRKENKKRPDVPDDAHASKLMTFVAFLIPLAVMLLTYEMTLYMFLRRNVQSVSDPAVQGIYMAAYSLVYALVYGTICRLCKHRGSLSFLYLLSVAFVPVFDYLLSRNMIPGAGGSFRNGKLLFYDNMHYVCWGVPVLVELYIKSANRRTLRKIFGALTCMLAAAMTFAVVTGRVATPLWSFHNSLDAMQQLAFFPVVTLVMGLVMGIWGLIFKHSRLFDLLIITAAYMLPVMGDVFHWKESFATQLNLSPNIMLMILMLPIFISFAFSRKMKKK